MSHEYPLSRAEELVPASKKWIVFLYFATCQHPMKVANEQPLSDRWLIRGLSFGHASLCGPEERYKELCCPT